MPRFSVLALALLTSCANVSEPDPELQKFWTIQGANRDYEQDRLEEIYRKAFTSAFLEAWEGHGAGPDVDIFATSDPDGTIAYLAGHEDGNRAGRQAFSENLRKQTDKDKH